MTSIIASPLARSLRTARRQRCPIRAGVDGYDERVRVLLAGETQEGAASPFTANEFARLGGRLRAVLQSYSVAVAVVADQRGRIEFLNPRDPGGVFVRRERAGELHRFVSCGHASSVVLQVG
ncbi:hypothetical protein [Mycobacterium interjectum]|uniref:hypothetical protein n=1 Tax=Mycobacterium interjectum TaxID=33895 RepID=UPI0021F269C7|nr:hypothetical protein [Mycobacterium interjectum]MCV7090841.1 hypothetical protein [Mycobacterium interjectum]